MTFINFKILIYIFLLLSSCSSHISNKFSDNSTSTQIKSNEFKTNKVKNKDDIAELSVDELKELISIEDKKAADVIMKAREDWFK